jgi:LCP family protein required for cell wall assembly
MVATSELGTTAWRRGPVVPVRRRATTHSTVPGRLAARWQQLPWRRAAGVTAVVVLTGLVAALGLVLHLDRSVTRVEVGGLGQPGGGSPGGGAGVTPMGASADRTPSDADRTTNDASGPAASGDGTAAGDETGATTDPTTAPDSAPLPPDVDVEDTVGEPLSVLVVGSDTREVLTVEERRRLRTGDFWGERTEVIALVRLDPEASSVRIVHVPRDTAVQRCDGTRGRVNAAHAIGERDGTGGLTCLVETLTAWSGLTIDHLVKVDFRGFIDIVDAIGGVEMELDTPLRDDKSGLDLPAGTVRLDGEDALSFVRARYLDDDFGRIARQQRFLREVQDEVRELGALGDVGRLVRLAEATAGAVELDDSLTLWRLRALVLGHRDTVAKPLESRTVPGIPDTSTGAYLIEPDEQAAAELFTWLVTGEEVGAAAPGAQRVPGHPEAPAGALEPDERS